MCISKRESGFELESKESEKEFRSRIEKDKVLSNPNPRTIKEKKGQRGAGTNLELSPPVNIAGRRSEIARKVGPSHCSMPSRRLEGSDSRTTARPLDGGALALGRTRAPVRGPTAAPSTTAAVAPALVSARRCEKGSLGVAALGAAADRMLQAEEARGSPAVHGGEGG